MHTFEQGDKSVELYYHRLKNLWDEYAVLEPNFTCTIPNCRCESHRVQDGREQRKRLLQFLMGLHESYSAARGQILMMNPFPTLPQAYSLIKQEEKQRQGFVTTASSSFFVNAKTDNSGSKSIGNPGEKKQLKCSYCHKEGHVKESCYKLIGYPPKGRGRGKSQATSGFKGSQANQVTTVIGENNAGNTSDQASALESLQQQMSHLMTLMKAKSSNSTPEDHIGMAGVVLFYYMLSSIPPTLSSSSLWIIDTRASNHMCCDSTLITNLCLSSHPYQICLPNKQTILVHQIGTVVLTSNLVLQNVLFVPNFNCNLLSVSKITKDSNCSVNFLSSTCVFQDQNQGILATGVEKEGCTTFHSPNFLSSLHQ